MRVGARRRSPIGGQCRHRGAAGWSEEAERRAAVGAVRHPRTRACEGPAWARPHARVRVRIRIVARCPPPCPSAPDSTRAGLSALAHPQVLQELEEQIDAAQRRATESMEEARVRMDEVRARSYACRHHKEGANTKPGDD